MKTINLIFLLLTITSFSLGAAEKRRPNIVLLMADDMGYECLSANGSLSYNTPVLDSLAKNGIRFNYTFSQPICTPSRVKIMTGLRNYKNYVRFGYLETSQKTFGNLLKDAGYVTCVVGKWQLNGSRDPLDTGLVNRPQHFGFDEYCLWNFIGDQGSRYADPILFQNGKKLEGLEDAYGPDVVSDYAVDFIKRNKEKPFFLYYPMLLVHHPFNPTPDSNEWGDKKKRFKNDNQYFKGMVEYTDKVVSKLIDTIRDQGLENDTIFIFTADNGTQVTIVTETKTGTVQGGKGSMIDAGTHVPMIVYNPAKIQSGLVYNELFEFSDFLPTLAEAAGVPVPEEADGRSFYPLFSNQKQEARETIFMHYDPLKKATEKWYGLMYYGRFVRDKTYKLYDDNRFYNVSEDPLEQNPIPNNRLTEKEILLKKKFQAELNSVPAYDFKRK